MVVFRVSFAMSVCVISKQPVEREALASLASSECSSVTCFRDVASLLAQKDTTEPGCVILDLEDTAFPAIPQLREMLEPLPFIIVSSRVEVARAVQAMKQGAADFITKPVERERLVSAVRGALAISRERMQRAQRSSELVARYQSLSARERDVVGAVLDGRQNREVASRLGIRPRTVEIHRSKAMTKLGARTVPDLVRIWLDLSGQEHE
jgi:two-component system, LuxR family, response regulator FixJ